MPTHFRLQDHLASEVDQGRIAPAVAATLLAIAEAGRTLAGAIAFGPLRADYAATCGPGGHGDQQKGLDVLADQHFCAALRDAPVAAIASEEQEQAQLLLPAAPLAVAFDPLDGSGNIEIGAPLGSIFGIFPATADTAHNPAAPFLRPGNTQLAAGYLLYGPYLAFVIAYGHGTSLFILDPQDGAFRFARNLIVPGRTASYAINAANRRHWSAGIARYVRDCVQGTEGPRHQDTNMRWLAAMVGEAHRILLQGGIYLYPADDRPGYRHGRLRLLYEANPIALLMEQAGGAATDGIARILDLTPASLHQKVPLVFGAAEEVARVTDYLHDRDPVTSPLFRNRTLFSEGATASGRA